MMQVAEVRETQPDCRLYIAITKCDQLDEPPSIAEQDVGELDSSSSTNGDCCRTYPALCQLHPMQLDLQALSKFLGCSSTEIVGQLSDKLANGPCR